MWGCSVKSREKLFLTVVLTKGDSVSGCFTIYPEGHPAYRNEEKARKINLKKIVACVSSEIKVCFKYAPLPYPPPRHNNRRSSSKSSLLEKFLSISTRPFISFHRNYYEKAHLQLPRYVNIAKSHCFCHHNFPFLSYQTWAYRLHSPTEWKSGQTVTFSYLSRYPLVYWSHSSTCTARHVLYTQLFRDDMKRRKNELLLWD